MKIFVCLLINSHTDVYVVTVKPVEKRIFERSWILGIIEISSAEGTFIYQT